MKKIKINKKFLSIFENSRFPNDNEFNKNKISKWMSIFLSTIEQYKRVAYGDANAYKLDAKDDLYVGIVTPFVKSARMELLSTPGGAYASLDESCQLEFECQLVKKLVYIFSFTISTVHKEKAKKSELDNIDINEYIKKLYKNPLLFFKEFPVLARMLSTHADYWVKSTFKILNRLEADFPKINDAFFKGGINTPSKEIVKSISAVQLNLSDPHEYAQTVAIISFKDGNKVVYKPKSLYAEYAFSEFIEWFNCQISTPQLKLKSVSIVDKDSYGWAEFIEHKECKTTEDVKNYYKKIGMFGAILYAMRGSDYHHDNLIAQGSEPYFVDHEMLFYPLFVDRNVAEFKEASIYDIQNNYYESVVGTRLFPIIEARQLGKKGDISAVGYFDPDKVNMALPFIKGEYQRVYNFKSSVIEGFEYAYNILQNNKTCLTSDESPISIFKQLDVRFNMRRTRSYLQLIHSIVVPAAFKNGLVYIDYIRQLCAQFHSVFSTGIPADIATQEISILARLDAPRFTVKCTSRGLNKDDSGQLRDLFELSGYELVLHRIKSLDNEKLEEQKKYLLQSLNEIGKAD